MLKLNLEIVPYGIDYMAYSIGKMKIGNIGGHGNTANYVVILDNEEIGKVEDFARDRGPWDLVLQAIELLPHDKRKGLHSD